MSQVAIGVDLGGTKILTAVVTPRGDVVHQHRRPTPQLGPPAVVEAIADSVASVLAGSGLTADLVRGVGVGAPGPLDPRRGVVFQPPNLAGWSDVPLADLLVRRLKLRVHVENDANAAALGEWWVGAGRGVDDLVYITVGTGVGGGIILGARLIHGVSGTAGEIGHMTIDLHGPPCPCGSSGCLEVLASGPAIVRMAREAIGAGRPTAIVELAGGDLEAVTAETVADAARRGDVLARELFDRAGNYLGVGVANLLNLLNPARVVIGGGVSEAGEFFLEPVRRTARACAFDRPARDAEIIPTALGVEVGAIGVAAVVFFRDEGPAH